MRVLLVSPFYAPSAAVGAKRFSFLSRLFQRRGFDVAVLTLDDATTQRRDESLPRVQSILAVGSLLPYPLARTDWLAKVYERLLTRVLAVPDEYVGWLLPSVAAGRRLIAQAPPDVVIATGPPFTAFVTGALLSRQAKARLVLDYRDPWTAYDWPKSTAWRKQGTVRRALEKWLIERADALVFATAAMQEKFEEVFGRGRTDRTRVITNGFDASDTVLPAPLPGTSFNILYAGSFYGERQIGILAEAAAEVARRGRVGEKPVAIHVFGSIKPADWARIRACGMQERVVEHAPVDHAEVLRYMKAADALYLPSGSDVSYALPFKLFDYLSVRRPVLAVAPRYSAIGMLMRELRCGELAPPDQPGAVADALERLVLGASDCSFDGAEQYSWEAVGGRYIELLQSLR